MASARHAEIDSFEVIVDTFADLTRHVHEVTLRFENTLIHYPVSVVSVDRALGNCFIDITSLGDIDSALAGERSFVLHARQASAALHSSPIRSQEILRREDRLGLRCPLPERLTLLRRRSYFRAALSDGMQVEVSLRAPDGPQWHTALRDLSVGGCLLSLPVDHAAGLKTGGVLYQLRARFPNGESFEAYSRVTHLHVGANENVMYVGVTFDIGLEDEEREVWFYVSEIEREVVRKTSRRPEMRPLAPSRLFLSEDQDSAPGSNGARKPASASD